MGKKTIQELADTIRKKMFVFEDILTMDERSIQRFIRDCDMKDIVYALKNATEEMSDLFYRNMFFPYGRDNTVRSGNYS